MIVGLRGQVRKIKAGALVLRVGPVDVRMAVPSSTALRIAPEQEIELYTHLLVRDDQLALYGFCSVEELEVFEALLSVSGVGPRMALAVLSTLDPGDVRRAILQGDARALVRAPGVGMRAASRIVADLQGKVALGPVGPEVGEPGLRGTVFEALISMGYSLAEARDAMDSTSAQGSPEEALRAALGFLADRQRPIA